MEVPDIAAVEVCGVPPLDPSREAVNPVVQLRHSADMFEAGALGGMGGTKHFIDGWGS